MRIQVLEILISYESGSCMVPQRFLPLQFQVCQPNVFSLLIAILALYPRKQFQLKFWMLQAKDLSNIRDGLCGHHELIQKWFERIITHHTKRSHDSIIILPTTAHCSHWVWNCDLWSECRAYIYVVMDPLHWLHRLIHPGHFVLKIKYLLKFKLWCTSD